MLYLWSGSNLPAGPKASLGNKQAQDTSAQRCHSLFQTEVFCITELASASQMEFREKHLVILSRRAIRVSVNLPGEKQAARFGALDAKIAWEMEDTPALPPQMTFEEKC